MTPDQAALVRKAKRRIALARRLKGEGEVDEAITTAYYGMFYLAQALLLGDDLAFPRHGAVIGGFGQYFASTDRVPRHLHRQLIHAFENRLVADYEAPSGLTDEDAAQQVAYAEEFLEVAEQLPGPVPEAGEETR